MNIAETYRQDIDFAINAFWNTRERQISAQKIAGAGARAGKHLDGVLLLLQKIALDAGIPAECIHIKDNVLPGYFRATKNWDFVIISPQGHLLVCIELKSQVGSTGNNFNNRVEEALGSAVDLRAAYNAGVFPSRRPPWLGYMVIMQPPTRATAVQVKEPYFPVLDEFKEAGYVRRYEILCQQLVLGELYDGAALITTTKSGRITYETPNNAASFYTFLESYAAALKQE